jgi:hypothetical protein
MAVDSAAEFNSVLRFISIDSCTFSSFPAGYRTVLPMPLLKLVAQQQRFRVGEETMVFCGAALEHPLDQRVAAQSVGNQLAAEAATQTGPGTCRKRETSIVEWDFS